MLASTVLHQPPAPNMVINHKRYMHGTTLLHNQWAPSVVFIHVNHIRTHAALGLFSATQPGRDVICYQISKLHCFSALIYIARLITANELTP
jgi:hypothetical protein